MSRPCDVCASKTKVRRILVEDRIIALCEQHAAEVRMSGVTTLRTLRAMFPEPAGRRSLVARRAPLDRRVFPPRPEGRRRSEGRRSGDRPE